MKLAVAGRARPRRALLTGGLVLLAFLALVAWRAMQASAPADPAPTVEQIRAERGVPVAVAAVTQGPLEVWQSFNGTVSGVREAAVRARTEDEVAEVRVAVGDRVRTGQTLVRIVSEGTTARARQAEASLAQARRNVERLRPLREAGAISAQEWEDVETAYELAAADLAAARGGLALASPLAGTVTEVIARPGLVPQSGDVLVRVADLSERVVHLRVSAADAARLATDQPARTAASPTQDPVEGRVRRVALQADPATRLVEVEVAFPPAPQLIPGTLATVQVRVAAREDTVQVPALAVRDGGVWVVEDGRVARREVELGLRSAEAVEVRTGLGAGERVVVQGASLLGEGARVRVVEPGAG